MPSYLVRREQQQDYKTFQAIRGRWPGLSAQLQIIVLCFTNVCGTTLVWEIGCAKMIAGMEMET